MLKLVLVACLCVAVSAAKSSYLPQAVYGSPVSVEVVDLQEPDFRGLPVYLVNLDVETEDGEVVSSLVHRNYGEFVQL